MYTFLGLKIAVFQQFFCMKNATSTHSLVQPDTSKGWSKLAHKDTGAGQHSEGCCTTHTMHGYIPDNRHTKLQPKRKKAQ